jgi:tryptophanyl-tRNA synthetase
LHGDILKVPKPTIQTEGARIMNLQDPTKKMSKSDLDDSGNILLKDDEATITKKIMRAVTDSGNEVATGPDKPALTNLLVIMSVLRGTVITDLEHQYAGQGYGAFKKDLATAVVESLRQVQTYHAELMKPGNDRIEQVLQQGLAKANPIAGAKLDKVKSAVGLL